MIDLSILRPGVQYVAVGENPTPPVISGNWVVIQNRGSRTISVIGLNHFGAVRSIAVNWWMPQPPIISGNWAFVASERDDKVYMIRLDDSRVPVGQIRVGRSPLEPVILDNRVVVASERGRSVYIIDSRDWGTRVLDISESPVSSIIRGEDYTVLVQGDGISILNAGRRLPTLRGLTSSSSVAAAPQVVGQRVSPVPPGTAAAAPAPAQVRSDLCLRLWRLPVQQVGP